MVPVAVCIQMSQSQLRQLKKRLADFFTALTEDARQSVVESYQEKYQKNLEREIQKILQHGTVMHIMHLLLNTRAQYDAEVILGLIQDSKLKPIANIICCRTTAELRVFTHSVYTMNILQNTCCITMVPSK